MRITTYSIDSWFLDDSCNLLETLKGRGLRFGPFTTMKRAEAARQELLEALVTGSDWSPRHPTFKLYQQPGYKSPGHGEPSYELRVVTTRRDDHLDHTWQIRFYRQYYVTKSVMVEGQTYTRDEVEQVTVADWAPVIAECFSLFDRHLGEVSTQTGVDIRSTTMDLIGDVAELEVTPG